MAYQVFQQLHRPNIDISLFGRAASQGAAVGNAIPTETTAAIRGVQEGIDRGLNTVSKLENIETANLRQERLQQEIDYAPKEYEQRQEFNELRIEHQKNINELAETQKELAALTRKNDVETALIESKTAVEQAKRKANDMRLDKEISEAVTSQDPATRRSVLTNQEYFNYLLRHPKIAERVFGRIYDDLTPDERDGVTRQLDWIKAEELKARDLERRKQDELRVRQDYDKATAELHKSDLSHIIKDRDDAEIAKLEVVRTGVYDVNEEGMKTSTQLGDPMPGGGYDVFDGDKRVYKLDSKAAADALTNWQNKRRIWQKVSAGLHGTEGDPTTGKGTDAELPEEKEPIKKKEGSKPRTVDEIAPTTKIPEEVSRPVLERGREAGRKAKYLERQFSALRRNPIAEAASSAVAGATPQGKEINSAIKKESKRLANETREKFRNGTPEEKQALRDWAEANGLSLDKRAVAWNRLEPYYERLVRRDLTTAYNEAFEKGLEIRAKEKGQEYSRANAAEEEREMLQGKTAEEALALQKSASKVLSKGVLGGKNMSVFPQTEAPADPGVDMSIPEGGMSVAPEAEPGAPAAGANIAGGNQVPSFVAANSMLNTYTRKQAASVYNKIMTRLGLNPERNKDRKDRVTNVLSNEYFNGMPAYVKAVGAIESAGITDAVSPTGVRGLMQVTQKVAASYGLNRNIPEQNVEAGKRYLEDMFKMFKGEKALAYAAYNAGPGTIRYAQKLAGGATDWKEVKKYLHEALERYYAKPSDKLKETFNYPEKVLQMEAIFELENQTAHG